MIRRYAEADDVARTRLLETESDEQLIELRDAPEGLWDDINAFLDEWVASPPGPHQDAALALDAFAHSAMEADFILERRAGEGA